MAPDQYYDELDARALRAGFSRTPAIGDFFRARNCVEYSLPITAGANEHGVRYGGVERGTWMKVLAIELTEIPANRGGGSAPGIAIQTRSTRLRGELAWVNVCKGRVRFADLMQASDQRGGLAA